MTFDEYSKTSEKTAIYPGFGHGCVYPVLGLCGEAGEVAEQFKKMIRDNNGEVNREFKERIKKELGDVLWYIWAVGFEVGVTLEEIAIGNVSKLADRQARGKLGGSGSDR